MSVNSVYLSFTETMTQICLYQRTVKTQTNLELNELFQQREITTARSMLSGARSVNRMHFNNARTGELAAFGGSTQTTDQCIEAAITHKNKQYQWLLAEAYEAFDKYLTHSYVFLGMENFSVWPLSDYGNNRLSDLTSMGWSGRLELLKNTKSKVDHILKQLRKCYPEFARSETTNALEINFRVLIVMCQKFRHHIVHDGGYINDPDSLTKKILDEASINGRARDAQERFIRSYIGQSDGLTVVNLLEVESEVAPLAGLGAHYDICDQLLKLLVSYAHLIKESSVALQASN
ncbi:hypothetical protein [Pseudomonas gingeri]|uniref:hypothetical protein n=1 Tax=Pseudomonas gingeri TaxID=117681 RepID=UPI0015BEA845|nr:hypothetical protein [Pseudomonas gingeri]NWD47802.1 hypothetical protein [Pseudomonas gingeri]